HWYNYVKPCGRHPNAWDLGFGIWDLDSSGIREVAFGLAWDSGRWGCWDSNPKPRIPNPNRQSYFLIIFSVSAAMIILPSFSVTSPVTSTVWLTCGIIFALLSAARPPPS